jgi:heme/copper-type cytochrome/quinol oxidase subunit 3
VLWLIVSLELLTFAMVFLLVASQRRTAPAFFAEGQRSLDPWLGLALTLLLVTSGALAATRPKSRFT